MKGKKFYLILVGLVIVGIGSVFLYREQRETRTLEFEGYEISAIEADVDALYNEEKTDLSNNIDEEKLEELEGVFSELHEKDISRRNKERIDNMTHDFLIAKEMLALEVEINDLFIELDIVDKNTTIEEVNDYEHQVLTYEMKTKYIDRNIEKLAYARKQINEIENATEFIEDLFDEADAVQEGVTHEDVEEAYALIEPIRNEEIKDELIDRIETVSEVLAEREEVLTQELEELEQENQEETEGGIGEPESTPSIPSWEPDPEVSEEPDDSEEPELESEEPEAPEAPEEPTDPGEDPEESEPEVENPEEPTEPETPEAPEEDNQPEDEDIE